MGAGRPASITKVAAYGYSLPLDQLAPIDQIGERIALFGSEVEARGRMERLAQRPHGQNKASIMSYPDTLEAAEASALYGTPDEVAATLQALRDVGAEYVLLNSTGGVAMLRRFTREVLPAFSGEPAVRAAV